MVLLVVYTSSILHYNYVEGSENIALYGKAAVDLSNQSMRVLVEVLDEVVKHTQQDATFVSSKGLDQEPLVLGKEEE